MKERVASLLALWVLGCTPAASGLRLPESHDLLFLLALDAGGLPLGPSAPITEGQVLASPGESRLVLAAFDLAEVAALFPELDEERTAEIRLGAPSPSFHRCADEPGFLREESTLEARPPRSAGLWRVEEGTLEPISELPPVTMTVPCRGASCDLDPDVEARPVGARAHYLEDGEIIDGVPRPLHASGVHWFLSGLSVGNDRVVVASGAFLYSIRRGEAYSDRPETHVLIDTLVGTTDAPWKWRASDLAPTFPESPGRFLLAAREVDGPRSGASAVFEVSVSEAGFQLEDELFRVDREHAPIESLASSDKEGILGAARGLFFASSSTTARLIFRSILPENGPIDVEISEDPLRPHLVLYNDWLWSGRLGEEGTDKILSLSVTAEPETLTTFVEDGEPEIVVGGTGSGHLFFRDQTGSGFETRPLYLPGGSRECFSASEDIPLECGVVRPRDGAQIEGIEWLGDRLVFVSGPCAAAFTLFPGSPRARWIPLQDEGHLVLGIDKGLEGTAKSGDSVLIFGLDARLQEVSLRVR